MNPFITNSKPIALRWLPRSLALAALLSAPGVAAEPPSKQQCARAYAETQTLRKVGKLREAREQALRCVQPTCPGIISTDCGTWLEEIERSLPTVVLGARGKTGRDAAAVRVTMDGETLATRLVGDALAVDPGEHAFRFELDGAPPIDLPVVIRMGEKNRRIDVSFAPAAPAPAPAPAPTPTLVSTPSSASGRAVSTPLVSPVVLTLGGVAVAGLGVFATFGILGMNQKSSLDRTCAPSCSLDQASSVRTKLIVGDVGLFTALAAVGAGTTVFLVGRRATSPSAGAAFRLEVAPAPSGGMLTARGSF